MFAGRPGAKSPSSNGPSGKTAVSDAQAREKLAVYVYEYLVHVGAKAAAQTFLSEIRWEKSISVSEAPGFLHSWWCVFWDLYCAAPERREQNEHSGEAKAFHDYSAQVHPAAHSGIPPEQHPAFQSYFPGHPGHGIPGFHQIAPAHPAIRARVTSGLQPTPGPPSQAMYPQGPPIDHYRGMLRPGIDQIPVSSSPMPLQPGAMPDAMAQGTVPPVQAPNTEMSPSHSSASVAAQNVASTSQSAGDESNSSGAPGDFQSLQPPDGGSFVIQKIKESMQEEAKRFSEESTRIDGVETAVEKREYY